MRFEIGESGSRRAAGPVGLTVLKIGGSLFTLPELASRLRRLIAVLGDARLLLVPGGGAVADVVRNLDRMHDLGDEAAHRLAIAAMSLNARFLCAVLPGVELVDDPAGLQEAWGRQSPAVVDATPFLSALERTTGAALPPGWHVTADSISAWIAFHLDAERLILVKSVDPPGIDSAADESSTVDAHFSISSRDLKRIEWTNLQREPLHIHPLAAPVAFSKPTGCNPV